MNRTLVGCGRWLAPPRAGAPAPGRLRDLHPAGCCCTSWGKHGLEVREARPTGLHSMLRLPVSLPLGAGALNRSIVCGTAGALFA